MKGQPPFFGPFVSCSFHSQSIALGDAIRLGEPFPTTRGRRRNKVDLFCLNQVNNRTNQPSVLSTRARVEQKNEDGSRHFPRPRSTKGPPFCGVGWGGVLGGKLAQIPSTVTKRWERRTLEFFVYLFF
ncbi:hypothetical protein IE53DRAFT_384022 [Violaceomyces palustris]|uniref:Uncharacterized protein n=1 Tax=Violaceomyces palustris TaxID=1673888 RepID=A0ACD0P610_9BASI|nr:hypothetical protein IE53DRAFT_384022 [Violaceomyces palustris]